MNVRLRILLLPLVLPIVGAKLFLWSSSLREDSVKSSEKRRSQADNRNNENNEQSKSNVLHRLKLFHKQDTRSETTSDAAVGNHYAHSLSPLKYLSVMFLYLQKSIQEMKEDLYPSDQSPCHSGSSLACALFRRNRFIDVVTEPKDAWEGFIAAFAALGTGYMNGMCSFMEGASAIGHGMMSACLSLKNDNGFVSEFTNGFQKGTAHIVDGLNLFAAGIVVGTRNLAVGLCRTPAAMRASQLGMMYYPKGNDHSNLSHGNKKVAVWGYYSLDDEDEKIRIEEAKLRKHEFDYHPQTTRTNLRRRRAISVKDRSYYDILGIAIDADSKEVRSAYRKEALKHHPDKTSSSLSSWEDASLSKPHINGFLDLTKAYQILSNEASRNAYDRHGLCFREKTILRGEGSNDDYSDLIGELFGTTSIRKYVGIPTAPLVDEMLGFFNNESVDIQNLKQRRRLVDISKYLRGKLNSYVVGEQSMEDFTHSCRKEAEFLLQDGDERTASFLRVIGKILFEEADQQIGLVVPFVRKTFSSSSQKIKSSIANARVYAPIYARELYSGARGFMLDADTNGDPDDCSSGQKEKETVNQDAVMSLLWHHIIDDIVATLQESCALVFADRGADSRLGFGLTPSLLKYQRTKKAEAMRILGREMVAACSGSDV